MKFTLLKSLKQDSMMKPILSGLLIFTILYLISGILVKHSSFGLFELAIQTTLLGNEEEFLDPMSTASFLEFWHMEIFFIMMILLSLSAVFIRLCKNSRLNIVLLNLALLSALTSLISLVLSFYLSSSFIIFYVVSFFTWHLIALYMSVFSLWNLHYDSSI